MNQETYDAFQELQGLDEATFSFDKPGVLALQTFLDDKGEESTEVVMVDPDAEDKCETEKDYTGDVILQCCVCNGYIVKKPSDVIVDKETQRVNIHEPCPYCYNDGGYKVCGQIKIPTSLGDPDSMETDEEEDEHIDVDDIVVEEKKDMKESLGSSVVAELPKFIEDAVKGLQNDEGTNYRYKFDDRFALFVGWSDGFAEEDKEVIHNPERPTEAIVAGIKVWTSDDMWTDYDYLNAPYEESGDVLDDTVSIAPDDDYVWLAQHFINDYEIDYEGLEVDKDGKIISEIGEGLKSKLIESPTKKQIADTHDKIDESCKKDEREIKEAVSEAAYDVADIIADKIKDKKEVSFDEFTSIFEDACKKVKGADATDTDFETDVRIILDMSGFETILDGKGEGGVRHIVDESCKKGKKKMAESLKIISSLDDYEPWSGAVDTWSTIQDAGMVDALDSYLEVAYPEGLTMTELNDILWFDGESVLADLGIMSEDQVMEKISDAVDNSMSFEFEDFDDLADTIKGDLEDEVGNLDVEVERDGDTFTVTVGDFSKEYELSDFKISDLEESLKTPVKEAKEEKEDLWDVVYDKLSRRPAGIYVTSDNLSVDRNDNIVVSMKAVISSDDTDAQKASKREHLEKKLSAIKDFVEKTFGDKEVKAEVKVQSMPKKLFGTVTVTIPKSEIIADTKEKTGKDIVVTPVNESVSNIQMTTDTDTISVDVDGAESVNVDVQPKEEVKEEAEEVIAPVDADVQAEIESNTEDGEASDEDEIEEFDEQEFDELGESYLKRVYNNVDSYKTTKGYINEGKIKLEGVINFKSGKQAKTSFVFEKFSKTQRGKLKLIGENLQLTNNRKAFMLTGEVKDKKLCLEALTYRYTAKDANGGKSVKLYGTTKIGK